MHDDDDDLDVHLQGVTSNEAARSIVKVEVSSQTQTIGKQKLPVK